MAQSSFWGADPWGQLDEMRREMDSLFGRLGGAARRPSPTRGVYPSVNLYETGDAYVLTAELPGSDPDDIHVSLEGTTVTLSGERKIDYAAQEEASIHRRERQAGSFRRAFELPAAIDAEKVEATYKNGVLILKLPKTPEHQPRQISVKAS